MREGNLLQKETVGKPEGSLKREVLEINGTCPIPHKRKLGFHEKRGFITSKPTRRKDYEKKT